MTRPSDQSYRKRRRKMCDSKRRLRNMRRGHMAAEAMKARGENVHPYKCPFCGHVHVGHSNLVGSDD